MEKFIELLDKISATSGKNDKVSLLTEVSSEYTFSEATEAQAAMSWAYDPRVNFFIEDLSKLPPPTENTNLHWAEVLLMLADRKVTGDKAKQLISNYLNSAEEYDAELFKRIISRKLAAGMGAKTINAVFPDMIYEHPYMRCALLDSKTLKGVKFPCISQIKLDGSYCDIVVTNESESVSVSVYTRYGNLVDLGVFSEVDKFRLVNLAGTLPSEYKSGYVLQGELLVMALNEDGEKDGTWLPRDEGNGFLNRDDKDQGRIYFGGWDLIPYEDFRKFSCNIPYKTRLGLVEGLLNNIGSDHFFMVETQTSNSLDDVLTFFKHVRAQGMEGTIVKNFDLKWKYHTSKDQLKLKVAAVADVVVTGWKEGKGQYKGMVGSMEVESSDGLVQFSVRCKTDAMVKKATKHIQEWIDKEVVFAVVFNDIVENELKEGVKALYLPRLESDKVGEKMGRHNADSLERIEEILNSFEFLV